nr:hypothetical protein [Tanacetum cinerariifolium]
GIILEKEQVKKQKLSEEAPESKSPTEDVSEDRIKEMMQLVPVEDVNLCILYDVGNKMHKAFPLLGESSHWQYKFPLPVEGVPTARRMEIPLLKSLHCYDEETASQRELAVTLRRWLIIMNQAITEQAVVDDDLVSTNDRVTIGSCNMRIDPKKTQKEATYHIVLDVLKLSQYYNAFLITADVLEIYMHQFLFIVPKSRILLYTNFSLTTRSLKLYQTDYRKTSVMRRKSMPYPRFTKVIIHHFLSKHKSISKRQGLFMNSIKDDVVLGRLKFISKGEDNQVYGMSIPYVMVNDDIKKSKAYQTYLAISTSIVFPKKARKGMKIIATPKKNVTKKTTSDESNVEQKGSEGAGITPEVIDEPNCKSKGSSIGAGITPKVPDDPKGKSIAQDDDWGSDEEEEIISIDDEETELDKDVAKSEKADEETENEEEVHSDEEVHTDEEELHADNEAHDDEYVHDDDDEKHDDTDKEMNDDENANEHNNDQEMVDQKRLGQRLITLRPLKNQCKPTFLGPSSFTPPQPASRVAESLSEYELKIILLEKMDKSHLYMTHEKHSYLYNGLLNSIMLDEAIVSGDVNPDKVLRKKGRGDDQDPTARLDQGKKKRRKGKDFKPSKDKVYTGSSSKCKTQSKPSSTNKHVNAEEPLHETKMDVEAQILNYVINEADQPQDDVVTTQGNPIWFKQPLRPPTPDPEWNKDKSINDGLEQTWFNDLVNAEKDLLTINKLMATPINFFKFAMNRLKLDKITKADLVGPDDIHSGDHVQAVAATYDSPVVPGHTTVETPMNMSPKNKAYFESEKEAIHLILTRIGDEIYSTVDPEWSRFVTIVKQQHKLDDVSYHKLFDILKQYQKEVNELHAERLARNANPLALVAIAQANQDPYYQTSNSQKLYAPSSKPSIPTRSHTATRYKGKEIAKLITPLSELASKDDSDPEQAQRDKDMQKNLALIEKYFKRIYKPTNNNLRTSSNSRNKNVDTTSRYKNDNQSGQFGNQRTMNVARARENVGSLVVQQSRIHCFNCKEFAEKGVPLQAEQYDWLADTDEEIDEQELEAHYSCMAKIQEVPTVDSGTDSEPLEKVQNDTGYNVFTNELQHSKQSESISNTCLVETDDSNVILDSSDMCDNNIQNEQNDVESDDERVALTNLIDNLKLDVDENKKSQKQLKKANTTLSHELKECKTILAKTSKTLRESNSVRDSCLAALQNKQTEFEKYKAFNDRTIDYDKLKHRLNETLEQLAQKDIEIKEGLKLKAYEILVFKEKHDELIKQSLLTKSHYEGLVKQKTKVITDLKLKEEHDIDKMISLEK